MTNWVYKLKTKLTRIERKFKKKLSDLTREERNKDMTARVRHEKMEIYDRMWS